MGYGQYDIIITIKGKDMREIEKFIRKNIRTIKEIQRTETLVVSDVPTR
jgi:DNA-binding Lrp family transcriptional regulator